RRELDKLGSTVATGMQLSIQPRPGVEIAQVYGYPAEPLGTARGAVIPIADLHAGETRKVVLRLRLRADALGPLALADVALHVRPVDALASRTLRVAAQVAITDDAQLIAAGVSREAIGHIERARTADALDQATRAYEAGDTRGATQMLEQRRQQVRDVANSAGVPGLAGELEQVTIEADGYFQAAPAESRDGKRARKKNRTRAFDLMR
ncbi:MAG: hypothetical protein AAGC55_26200, partial [Myxococcota bacterium]